ncbi:M20 family metallopeptidase [Nitratireductor pacificus]|uniref:Peptidase M20 dimerisation domain-containing protein n=1 Tax=Nitratireductor pacificus pht-3B TaxID=391937 RepID=K2N231_9HYPH|nr:M20 family metallopeptidase [Nitratireductor pacificus]EKF18298.1 hypothetical protein NA2_14142 [Nitratireductor pacificus pht-3B]
MTRDNAISRALASFDDGRFREDLARRIAFRTESQDPARAETLLEYLDDEMKPPFREMGFSTEIVHGGDGKAPFLIAERIEDEDAPTVLGYGHGDVVSGRDEDWLPDVSPWRLTGIGGNWYGRGIADNKAQHSVNMSALRAVLDARGRLGFNAKYLIEMGEERGSPGLHEVCARYNERLAADILIASDGPRLNAGRPTVFLGSRGGVTFDLWIDAREGQHHSGNWGGALSNPGIQLAHALASLIGPSGRILVPELVPGALPPSVRNALADCVITSGVDGLTPDEDWGEPGLTPAERVFGWCTLEVLAYETGNPRSPVNAIPSKAWARLQLRFVVGIDPDDVLPAVRRHLDRHGFEMVRVAMARDKIFRATRLDPEDPWAQWAAASIARTTGKKPALLPNFGGTLPNDAFAEILGARTLWVPHSYPGCSQHAPNEHLPTDLLREGLAVMAGLYWDLGEPGTPAL